MNKKSIKERAQILSLLVEGNSLRATTRIIRETQGGCSINTVTKLLEEIGEACAWYQDQNLRNLPCKRVQVDEIWSFVYSKQKNVPEGMEGEAGDVWTWTAIDADTKLVPSWRIGSRDSEVAHDFVGDLASRMANRIQLTSDGYKLYVNAVESAFGADVDYAMLVKIYGDNVEGQKRYSPAQCTGAVKQEMVGKPDVKYISTSFAERQNLTMRMSMRRFTRLTNAFSKKVENHCHAIALHFMHYNFCRIHKSLKVAPAMAAGVSKTLWSLEDVVNMADAYWDDKIKKSN
jgi:IS1 family transposase